MSAPNSLQDALARTTELEAELETLKNEMEILRQRHETQLEAQKVQHKTQLEAATMSTRAQIEHARMQSELQSIQLQAGLVEQDRESYLERMNALASELSEEIEVLLSFSRAQATSYYAGRVIRESEALQRAEEDHGAARRTLARKEAEAQASGQRTIAQMAEIDLALNLARAEAHAAGIAARDAKTRLDLLQQRLARCASDGS